MISASSCKVLNANQTTSFILLDLHQHLKVQPVHNLPQSNPLSPLEAVAAAHPLISPD